MKQLKFICAQPDDIYYTWQVHLWLESLRKIGHSDKAIVLLFTPDFRDQSTKWGKIIDLYPEAEFVFYKDVDKVSSLLGIYIPILRPYCLMRYFRDNPTMKDNAVFYCDSDVIFTESFNVSQYITDDINYLSDTNSYINASYFDSKVKDVLPEKLEAYKQIDVLDELANKIGITRQIAEANKTNLEMYKADLASDTAIEVAHINHEGGEKATVDTTSKDNLEREKFNHVRNMDNRKLEFEKGKQSDKMVIENKKLNKPTTKK